MITLPVSSSMYQSMVANIQQIHTNGDGTLCITPMQVQKSGHQHPVGQITSITSHTNINTSCSDSLNSSYSSASSENSTINVNCHQATNNQYGITSHMQSSMNCDSQGNNGNNLLELCRVLSQSNQTSHNTATINSNCFPVSLDNLQLNSLPVSERRIAKTKKAFNRSQFNIVSNDLESESAFIDQSDIQTIHSHIDLQTVRCHDDGNDSNNNVNSGEIGIDNDLKCGIITSTVLSESQKSAKPNTNFNSARLDGIDPKNIKTECEIDVA